MKYLINILSLIFLFISCKSNNCKKFPDHFRSDLEAITFIKNSLFEVKDSIEINSYYIKSANYYSCDGKIGYFLYQRTSGSEFFNTGVPMDIWENFKKASFKDSFYNNKIAPYKNTIVEDVNLK